MAFARWLHLQWPAGLVEPLPEVNEDGTTRVPGLRVVGDLTGIPLLKLAADSGAKAVHAIASEPGFVAKKGKDAAVYDLAIVGGGVSGISAAMEAKKLGLRTVVFEAAHEFNTIQNFPKGKPIFTYPTELKLDGEMQLAATVKEALVEELEAQRKRAGVEAEHANVDRVERRGDQLVVHHDGKTTRALRVLIAIGRSGNYRLLGVPGETLDKVYQRLFDPHDYAGQNALVVGGGDSAAECAVALAKAGAKVTLSYRKKEFTRPKPENLAQLKESGAELRLGTTVKEITADSVAFTDGSALPNDVVFSMIGREPPLDFFRRSGVPIRGEWTARTWLGFLGFFALCLFVYNWKASTSLNEYFSHHHLFPFNVPSFGGSALGRALTSATRDPGLYYSFAYTMAIVLFGIARIRRRKTPYVTRQTLTLMAVQIVPLFLLPYLVLPWMGNAGVFASGFGKTLGDNLFPDGSYWRAFGFILAWPLFVWNFFSPKPMTWWLVIGGVQTFVLIPLLVRRWGKGAYCGWICSCGALAETMGDLHRQKMPHGPRWNRLNFVGQVILWFVFALFLARVVTWYSPRSTIGHALGRFYDTAFYAHQAWDYYHVVDLFLAGVVGVGMYFWFSGRVWCRFACPLAALMHLYARFSKFRIFAEKKKCISCNVCTSVCHQGIDVMSFANRGLAMEDPECVRCSACVQSCPTGTLTFGRLGRDGAAVYDRVSASPVQRREGKTHLQVIV